MSNTLTFTLPKELAAKEPPELRGLARDQVKLMVFNRTTNSITHSKFRDLAKFLKKGDLLVFNVSRTIPASLQGRMLPSGTPVELRLAEHLPDDSWLALLLCVEGERFACGLRTDAHIALTNGLGVDVIGRHLEISRLWKIRFSQSGSRLLDSIYKLGQPIRYEYLNAPYGLDYYQNVYSTEPGSAEMPSAGRPFTWRVLLDLKRHGIDTTQVVLHTGLSSYMDNDLDRRGLVPEEKYQIGEAAAEKVNAALRRGRRIIAVGTTPLRALESAACVPSHVEPRSGYTSLRVNGAYRLKVVGGLLTGLHESESTHLDILRVFLTEEQILRQYNEALNRGYLWHEFGDVNLIL